MNSFQEEIDDNGNGALENIDGNKNCNDNRLKNIADSSIYLCQMDASDIKNDGGTLLLYRKDYSNTKKSGRKTLLSHRLSKNPKVSSTNRISNVALKAAMGHLVDSKLGMPNKFVIALDVNPSEPFGKYQCFLCSLNFIEKTNLYKHLLKHFDHNRRYICQVCDKAFPRKYDLQIHINTWTDFKPHQCEQCDKAFPTSSKLGEHRTKTHSGMSPYKCDKCDYKTFERNHLVRHSSIHMDERPFKCNYCSYASKSQRYLTTHEKIHRDGRKCKCDICYSGFVERQQLRAHRKTHFLKGLTIHRCRFCALELDSPHALRKHVEHFHSDEVLK